MIVSLAVCSNCCVPYVARTQGQESCTPLLLWELDELQLHLLQEGMNRSVPLPICDGPLHSAEVRPLDAPRKRVPLPAPLGPLCVGQPGALQRDSNGCGHVYHGLCVALELAGAACGAGMDGLGRTLHRVGPGCCAHARAVRDVLGGAASLAAGAKREGRHVLVRLQHGVVAAVLLGSIQTLARRLLGGWGRLAGPMRCCAAGWLGWVWMGGWAFR